MFAYLLRRLLYAIPILIGVNLLTFALFFVVNTPDDMARMQLGIKRVTPEAIEKMEGRARVRQAAAAATAKPTEVQGSPIPSSSSNRPRMFAFDFGRADDGRDIGREIVNRMGPSLAIALPTFVIGLLGQHRFALLMVLFRATRWIWRAWCCAWR